jgi:hypothetical protein
VYFAAIGAGLLAIITVLSFLIHRHFRRRRDSFSRPGSTSRSPYPNGTPKTTGSSGGTGFLGYPPSPPNIQTSSSHSHDSGSPPSTGRLKKSNSAPKRLITSNLNLRSLSPRGGGGEGEPEMVMVTYEEGLKKLGLDQRQHILYPDPPSFGHDGQVSASVSTPPFSSNQTPNSSSSTRPTPTTASLLTPGKLGSQRAGYGREYDDSPLRNKHSPSTSPSPYPKSSPPPLRTPTTLREHIGRAEETGRFPTDSELMTTGVPSYYHHASNGRYRSDEPE